MADKSLKRMRGDCCKANASAFFFYLSSGRYPTEAKIPPNDKRFKNGTVGGKWHQLVEFQKLIKNAYDWKLIQGTIIHNAEFKPMAHSWCEATCDDIGGLWNAHNSPDGRFVFDFTSTETHKFFLSVADFNRINHIPLEEEKNLWEGYEKHYHRFEYNPEEAKTIITQNMSTWKFYEFDSIAMDKELGW